MVNCRMKDRKTRFLTENSRITNAYFNIVRKINEETNQDGNQNKNPINFVSDTITDARDAVEDYREKHRNRPTRGTVSFGTAFFNPEKAKRKEERYRRRAEKKARKDAEDAEKKKNASVNASENNADKSGLDDKVATNVNGSSDYIGNIDVAESAESYPNGEEFRWGIMNGNGDWFLNGTNQEITGKEFGPDSESAFRFTHDGAYKNIERWGDSMEDYEVRELPPTNSEIYKEYREFVSGHEPCVETKDGPIYIEYDPNRNVLKYGTDTNTGLLEDGNVEYDKNMTMLWNMQNVIDEIFDKFGEYEEESDE